MKRLIYTSPGDIPISNKIQIRRGTKAQLDAIQLDLAEFGFTTDTHELYIGDPGSPGDWPRNIMINWASSDGYAFHFDGGGDGYLTFFTGTDSISGEQNLFWDRYNNKLGINCSSPTHTLTVDGYVTPLTDNAHCLGTPEQRWQSVYVGPNSLHITSTTEETGISYDWRFGIDQTTGNEGKLVLMQGEQQFMVVDSALSEIVFPTASQLVTGGPLKIAETAAPTFNSGFGKIYVNQADKKLHFIDSTGSDIDLASGSQEDIDNLDTAINTIRKELDGYVTSYTETEHYNQLSDALTTIRKDLDGYTTVGVFNGLVNTEQEHYAQTSDAIISIRKDLDGYATTSQLSGLDATQTEHYNQHSQNIQDIRSAADGYATTVTVNGLDLTVSEHYTQHASDIKAIVDVLDGYINAAPQDLSGYETKADHGSDIKAIIDVIDGYATTSTVSGLDTTVSEHYVQHANDIKAIIDVIDGYSNPVIDLSPYETKADHGSDIKAIIDVIDGYASDVTVSEHYTQLSNSINTIRQGLDGYVDYTGTPSSGYLAIFNDANTLKVDSELYWDSVNKRLGIGTSTPAALLQIRKDTNAVIGFSVYNADTGASALAYGAVANIGAGGGGFTFYGLSAGYTASGYAGVVQGSRGIIEASSATSNGLWLGSFHSSAPVVFYTANSEKMRILSDGKVGIGTPTPGGKLEILNAAGGITPSNYFQITGSIADNSNYPGMTFKGGTYPTTYPSIAMSNGGLTFQISGGFSATYSNQVRSAYGSNAPGNAYFDVNVLNGSTTTELIYVKDNGNVGLGNITTPLSKLSVKGGASIGANYATGSAAGDGQVFIESTLSIGSASTSYSLSVEGGNNQPIYLNRLAEGVNISGNTAGNARWFIGTVSSPSNMAQLATYNGLHLMLMPSSGKVGIGSAALTPANALSVSGATSIGSGYYASAAPTNGLLVEGDVGVGTASPTEKLEVVGNLKITGGEIKNLALSQAFDSIRQSLDGYALSSNLTGLDTTVSEHYTQHGSDIKAIIDSLDGYANVTTDLSAYETKADHGADIKAIIDVIDGYALDADLTGLQTTEAEHYTQQSAINQDILSSLDGYIDVGNSASMGDGYVAFFDGNNKLSGDNDLFWDRENNRLGVGTQTPSEKLDVVGNVKINGTLNMALPAAGSNYIVNSLNTTDVPNTNLIIHGGGAALNATGTNLYGGELILSPPQPMQAFNVIDNLSGGYTAYVMANSVSYAFTSGTHFTLGVDNSSPELAVTATNLAAAINARATLKDLVQAEASGIYVKVSIRTTQCYGFSLSTSQQNRLNYVGNLGYSQTGKIRLALSTQYPNGSMVDSFVLKASNWFGNLKLLGQDATTYMTWEGAGMWFGHADYTNGGKISRHYLQGDTGTVHTYYTNRSAAGNDNLRIYASCNAAGEYNVVMGTAVADADDGYKSVLLATATDVDGTASYKHVFNGLGEIDLLGINRHIRSTNPSSDVTPTSLRLLSASAYSASTGNNRIGSDIVLRAGFGLKTFTAVSNTLGSVTARVDINGSTYNLVSGTDFALGTDNTAPQLAVTAANLASAINSHDTLKQYVVASSSAAVVSFSYLPEVIGAYLVSSNDSIISVQQYSGGGIKLSGGTSYSDGAIISPVPNGFGIKSGTGDTSVGSGALNVQTITGFTSSNVQKYQLYAGSEWMIGTPNFIYGWRSADNLGGSTDTALSRLSAGTVKITDGSTGLGSAVVKNITVAGDIYNNALSEAISSIRQACDGYYTSADALSFGQTVDEHYTQHSQNIQDIRSAVDGYATVTTVNGLDVTVSEHYNQQGAINNDIIKSLDGYTTSTGATGDGYLAFFTGSNKIAGDNDLFWDRANNRLGIQTSAPTKTLSVAGDLDVASQANHPGNLVLLTENVTTSSGNPVAMAIWAKSSAGSISDGFGSWISYLISDSVSGATVGYTGVVRDGANNSGRYVIYTTNAGSITEKFTIKKDGKTGIGTATPENLLTVYGSASVGTSFAATAAPTNGLLVEGNVGIGISPSYKLHVYNNTTGSTASVVENPNSGSSAFAFSSVKSQTATCITQSISDSFTASSYFGTTSGNRSLVYTGSGTTGGLWIGTFGSNPLVIGTNDAERIRVLGTGLIGIGTQTPSEKLEVVGNLKITGGEIKNLALSQAFDSIRQSLDGYAMRALEDQRWIDDSTQLQDLRNAADGYQIKLGDITLEPTGFVNRTDSTISFNATSRLFTIAPAVTSFDFYIRSTRFTKTTAQTVTIADTTNLHYIYFDSSGILVSSTSPWEMTDAIAFVAAIYRNAGATDALVVEERHGLVMDWATHQYLHSTVSTRFGGGLAGTFNSNNTFAITAGQIFDEDLMHDIAPQTTCRLLYRNGTGGWSFAAASTNYYLETGGTTGVVKYDSGTGTPVDVPINDRVAYWVYATNDTASPIWVIMGQREDNSLALAQANNIVSDLVLPIIPSAEMKLLYRVIIRRNGTSEVIEDVSDYRTVSTLPGTNFTATDHGSLAGLYPDDDHPQYLLADGTRALGGDLIVAGSIINDDLTETIQTVRSALDGYALSSDLTGLQTTEAEHYTQQNAINQDILSSLDGYIDVGNSASMGDGYVAFFDGSGKLSGDNDLFWDRENNRLGIGKTNPTVALDVNGSINGTAINSTGISKASSGFQCGINYGIQTITNAINYGGIGFGVSAQVPNTMVIRTGTDANSVLMCEWGDSTFNFAHPLQTNPTLFLHSANQDTTEWLSFTHDQTDGYIATGKGAIKLSPFSGQVLFPDGTAAAPSIQFASSGMGIGAPGGRFSIMTLGAARVEVTNSDVRLNVSNVYGPWYMAQLTKGFAWMEPGGSQRSSIKSPSDGTFQFSDAAATAGVWLDVSTNAGSVDVWQNSAKTERGHVYAGNVWARGGNLFGMYGVNLSNGTWGQDAFIGGSNTNRLHFLNRDKNIGFTLEMTTDNVMTVQNRAASGPGAILTKRVVEVSSAVEAAPNVLTGSESRTLLTNTGIAAQNYHTLPTLEAGLEFTFYNDSTNGIRITPAGSDTIQVAADTTGASGYIESTAVGSSITLVSLAGGWITTAIVGTWSVI